eukprot:Rhum_TRINITY_DN14837_c1_g2::Rhum_TRINITY_DN14837_c1_g2_i1::g.120274::m.120274
MRGPHPHLPAAERQHPHADASASRCADGGFSEGERQPALRARGHAHGCQHLVLHRQPRPQRRQRGLHHPACRLPEEGHGRRRRRRPRALHRRRHRRRSEGAQRVAGVVQRAPLRPVRPAGHPDGVLLLLLACTPGRDACDGGGQGRGAHGRVREPCRHRGCDADEPDLGGVDAADQDGQSGEHGVGAPQAVQGGGFCGAVQGARSCPDAGQQPHHPVHRLREADGSVQRVEEGEGRQPQRAGDLLPQRHGQDTVHALHVPLHHGKDDHAVAGEGRELCDAVRLELGVRLRGVGEGGPRWTLRRHQQQDLAVRFDGVPPLRAARQVFEAGQGTHVEVMSQPPAAPPPPPSSLCVASEICKQRAHDFLITILSHELEYSPPTHTHTVPYNICSPHLAAAEPVLPAFQQRLLLKALLRVSTPYHTHTHTHTPFPKTSSPATVHCAAKYHACCVPCPLSLPPPHYLSLSPVRVPPLPACPSSRFA